MAEAASRLLQTHAETGERGRGPLQRGAERVVRGDHPARAVQGRTRPCLARVRRERAESRFSRRRVASTDSRLDQVGTDVQGV